MSGASQAQRHKSFGMGLGVAEVAPRATSRLSVCSPAPFPLCPSTLSTLNVSNVFAYFFCGYYPFHPNPFQLTRSKLHYGAPTPNYNVSCCPAVSAYVFPSFFFFFALLVAVLVIKLMQNLTIASMMTMLIPSMLGIATPTFRRYDFIRLLCMTRSARCS
jgi:hypothetical protein